MSARILSLVRFYIFISIFITSTPFADTDCLATATADCKYGVTAAELASQIEGVGITITNPRIRHGAASQYGTYENGLGANLEIDEGIILTGSTVAESFTTNSSWHTSLRPSGTYNDADLVAIDTRAIYNPVIFEFDVTLDENTRLLLIDYQFASDEYNEYVGSQFNDAFGFFVSGGDLNQTYNIARVVNNQTYVTIDNIDNYAPVTVNNVNNGSVGDFDDNTPEILTNTSFYIDNCNNNEAGTRNCSQATAPVLVEYDGLTHALHATLDNLTPGTTYHFKMAIADTADAQWDTGVFVNKINGLREPSICYDYAYKQNDIYLTEGYDSSKGPYINANVTPNNQSMPVELAMYFRNTKDSEIVASNIVFNLIDINTSQASYDRESVWVTEPNSFTRTKVNDSALAVSDSFVTGIPVSSFDAFDYFYIYASINPITSPLQLPINARIDYDLTIPLSANDSITVERSSFIDQDVPICSGGLDVYNPVYGNFNVIENGLYTDESNYLYNINTQVTNRRGNLSVVSVDANTSDLHILKSISTAVLVDMLDMGSFHFTTASCSEVTNSISDRVMVIFSDQAISPLIPEDVTFNSIARQNAAFRVSYNTDANGSLIQLETLDNNGEKRYNLLNLPNAELQGNCATGTVYRNDKVSDHCTDAGTSFPSAMTKDQLDTCMECIYGINTELVCSRDNFAIRPEAFVETVYDQNISDLTVPRINLAQNYTGETTINPQPLHIAAGYNYIVEVNATNHVDNNPSRGYNVTFNQDASSPTALLTWAPTTAKTNCNDTQDQNVTVFFTDGNSSRNASVSQVGEYNFQIRDTTWTQVDSIVQVHNSGSYFTRQPDCVVNSTFVAEEPLFDGSSRDSTARIDNLNGCNISSTHTNVDNGRQYVDLNVTLHPYKFDLTNIIPSIGTNHDANITAGSFIYMSDVNDSNDENMSFHLNGTINTVGADNILTSNFVNGCYAEPLQVKLNKQTINLPVAYQYKLHILDENGTQLREAFNDLNNTPNSVAIAATDFIKNAGGNVNTILNLNYARAVNTAINPQVITFNTYNVECTTAANCTFAADLNITNQSTGEKDLNSTTIKHYYGRTHAPRQRYVGDSGNAFIYYEVFCDVANDGNKSLLQNGLSSRYTDDPRWFVNTVHQTARDGQVNAINQRGYSVGAGSVTSGLINLTTPTVSPLTYNSASTRGYPYKATMELNNSNWLIYNKYDINATRNEFEVEFANSAGNWAGQTETDSTTKTNAAKVTNRRLMW